MKNYGQGQDNIHIKLKGGEYAAPGQKYVIPVQSSPEMDGTGQCESFTTDINSKTETNEDNMKCGKVTDL